MENMTQKPSIGKRVLGVLKNLLHKKWFRVVVILLVIILIGKTVIGSFVSKGLSANALAIQTAKSEQRDIQRVISSSGTVQPLNKYEVKSLVEGEVISADFEEGDEIKEGDVLYHIGSKSMDSRIKAAKNSVKRAEEKYDQAVENYEKSVNKYDKKTDKLDVLNVKAKADGVVTELNVKKGDSIQAGVQIAKIYDNSYMLLTVPFNSSDVSTKWVGKSANVEIDESGEVLKGSVTKVSRVKQVLSGNRVVQDVTIKVKNPGGITTATVATATVNSIACSNEGTFKVLEEKVITADTNGEISQMKVEEGDRVKEGDTILILESDSVTDQLDTYQSTVDSAQITVEDAQNAIEDAKLSLQEQLDAETDYEVTAPISGQIVRKDVLEGDTIKSTNASNVLCVIYDLSALTFEMNIDELDIKSVSVGQKVQITADAIQGEKFEGEITSISLESKTNNGVTQYPVTVRIGQIGGLLPGMNVTGEIVVEKAENVVAVPVDALMRGDVVYVKDDTVKEPVGDVPVGFKEVKVEVGIADDEFIEIKSGLEKDVEVYCVPQAAGADMGEVVYSDGETSTETTTE